MNNLLTTLELYLATAFQTNTRIAHILGNRQCLETGQDNTGVYTCGFCLYQVWLSHIGEVKETLWPGGWNNLLGWNLQNDYRVIEQHLRVTTASPSHNTPGHKNILGSCRSGSFTLFSLFLLVPQIPHFVWSQKNKERKPFCPAWYS